MELSGRITDTNMEPLGELAAVRLVCAAMARLFSYPSTEKAIVFTNRESVEYLFGLLKEALLADEEIGQRYELALVDTEMQPEHRARLMRRIFTQLFYCPRAPIPLEGRYWVSQSLSGASAKRGEEASVRQIYNAAGIHVRSEVTELACALPTELDFVAYLLEREIECSRAGSGAQALIWKRQRLAFSNQHLVDFGRVVADRIEQESSWSALLFWAAALRKIVERCIF